MEWSERHTQIVAQAAELFATKGIAGTKVRDIADRVGVLSGSLYHYFPSKDAIADVIVTRYLDDLTHEYQAILKTSDDPRTRLGELVKTSFQVSQAHPYASEIYQNNGDYLHALPSHEHIRGAARAAKDVWMTVIEKGIANGEFRSDLPADLLHGLIRDAVWISLRWFKPTEEFGFEQCADSVVSVFLDGVSVRP